MVTSLDWRPGGPGSIPSIGERIFFVIFFFKVDFNASEASYVCYTTFLLKNSVEIDIE